MSYIHPRPAPAQRNNVPAWTGNDQVRIARLVQRLHDLGPRPLLEFLTELAADESVRVDLEINLERYARHDPGAVPDDLDLQSVDIGRCACGLAHVADVLCGAGLASGQLKNRYQRAAS